MTVIRDSRCVSVHFSFFCLNINNDNFDFCVFSGWSVIIRFECAGSLYSLRLHSSFGASFMFDEPSSYLDVKQRLKAAITIRSLINPDR